DEEHVGAEVREAQCAQTLCFKFSERLPVLGDMNTERRFCEHRCGADRKLRWPTLHDWKNFFLLRIFQRERYDLFNKIAGLYGHRLWQVLRRAVGLEGCVAVLALIFRLENLSFKAHLSLNFR